MEPRYRLRIYLLTALVLVGVGALLSRLYEFQIKERDFYQKQVPGNRLVTVREPGIRGVITDRTGRIELARNRRNYEVSFNLAEIQRAYNRRRDEEARREDIATEDGMPRIRERTDIVTIVKEWVIPPLVELGLAKNFSAKAMEVHFVTHGGLVPFSYRADLDYDEFARFAEHSLELPGVSLDVRPQREYPYGALASHLLGYTQAWEKGQIPEEAKRKYDHYIGEEKGKGGIEATLDDILRGPEGSRTLVKDFRGRVVELADYKPPRVGASVSLTIDARAQYLVSNVLRRAGRAAGVVMDVRTGEILAMASVPDYNPNDFIPSIDGDVYRAYLDNPCDPFTDRCIAAFTPGSTFKAATAAVGALHGLSGRSFTCEGFVSYGSYKPACWLYNMRGGSHGGLDLEEAIQKSCNPYFFKLGNAIGAERMTQGLLMLGFGKPTGLPLPNEKAGNVPGSRAWRSLNRGRNLTPADVAQLSIGQGDSLATPLQLCALTACLANGGRYYEPRLIKEASMPDGRRLIEDRPKLRLDLVEEGVPPAGLEHIRKGMWKAANEPGGTAGRARIPDVEVAAKTGTAQTADAGKRSHNSWTIAFAPYDEPRYAVAVLVQNGKSGGKVCGPLVHLILRGLLARDEGMILPLSRLDPALGHLDPIEEIVLPEDVIAALEGTEGGETGDESAPTIEVRPTVTLPAEETVTPEPVITPEVDEAGSVVPRAVPVEEPE